MLVSYNWLKQYVDIDGISAEDLAEKITRSGIEVEGVATLNEGITGVVIGHVLEREQHPDADKLSKCLVDVGEEEPVQIICGAPNVGKDQKVAVAKVGAVLPGNFKIKKAKLRGEASHGMICSLQELGIESKLVAKEYSEGIFVFPSDVEVGQDALAYLQREDKVLELGLTPNRSDCLSMLGVAYEVAAILGKEVKWPEANYNETAEKASDYISVNVEAEEDNPLYVAKIVKNVKIGPSPLWMQGRLMAAGIRPHNNVVDITNYILLEYGQPLHAFDYDRLGSKEVLVRRAKAGEKIVTLDDAERTLTEGHLVITNGTEPIALAGVMGGANSEVGTDTTTVLIESAYFNGKTVRKASKEHGLRSEASARFEKGIDPNRTHHAAERAAAFMVELAGGEVVGGSVEFNEMKIEPAVVTTTIEKINAVLGTSISAEEAKTIFTKLQFDVVEDNGTFTVTVPTRRGDITIEEDLVEEVARLFGYDNIPTTLPVSSSTPGALTAYQAKRRKVRNVLEGAGLLQTITYSLTSDSRAKQFALEDGNAVRLAMPMSEERSTLRLSLLPHLLEVVQHNIARQLHTNAIYEISSVFLGKEGSDLPEEKERLAGVLTGLWHMHQWQGEKKAVDFYVAKGILDTMFETLGLASSVEYQRGEKDGLHPGRTAEVFLNGESIGFVGQLHPETQNNLDLPETYVFEIALSTVLSENVEEIKYEAIPRYPSISRDIALVVERSTPAGELQKVIVETGGKLLKDVKVFDLYEGDKIDANMKSVAFSLRYYHPEHTLTDEEVTKVHNKVLAALEEKCGATLRS